MVNPTAAREISFEQAKKTIYNFITNACYIKLWEKSYLLVLVKKVGIMRAAAFSSHLLQTKRAYKMQNTVLINNIRNRQKKDNAKFKKYMQSKQISER